MPGVLHYRAAIDRGERERNSEDPRILSFRRLRARDYIRAIFVDRRFYERIRRRGSEFRARTVGCISRPRRERVSAGGGFFTAISSKIATPYILLPPLSPSARYWSRSFVHGLDAYGCADGVCKRIHNTWRRAHTPRAAHPRVPCVLHTRTHTCQETRRHLMYTFHVAANCAGHRKDSPWKCNAGIT